MRMSRNVGFARANNVAFGLTTADAVLLLNSDAELTPHALGALASALETDATVGAAGPVLVGTDGRVQYEGGRRDPSILGRVRQHQPPQRHASRAASSAATS